MLRTADELIAALRARKDELELSNAVVDELSGMTDGYFDKVAGPSRIKTLGLCGLMAIAGALGLAVQLVPDPDAKVAGRWERRQIVCVRANPASVKPPSRKPRRS